MRFWFGRKRMPAFGTQKRCKRCGRNYVITSIETRFLSENALPQPNVCRLCLKEGTLGDSLSSPYPHVLQREQAVQLKMPFNIK